MITLMLSTKPNQNEQQDLQYSEAEHKHQLEFLGRRHGQPPHFWKWENKNGNI